MARDTIELHGLTLECILGVLPREREEPQTVRVDVKMRLDLVPAGQTGQIASTIDYDQVATLIGAMLRFRRYRLLENAAHEICAMLLGIFAPLCEVELRVKKPFALLGRAESAAVTVVRTRDDFERRHEVSTFGEVDVLLETKEAGLYLLHVAAGRQIPRHHHRVMRELEWLVAGELCRGGQRVPLASPVERTYEQPHEYRNDSDAVATLFCCDVPPFIPEDEIVLGQKVGQ